MRKYPVDLHTHTIISGHAYSTLLENIEECKEKGIGVYGVSDHAPSMPGGAPLFYFGNLKVIPRIIKGVTVLKGAEGNIIDYNGNIDLPTRIQKSIDYMIISFHDVCISPGTIEENTIAALRAMDNPNVTILGHCGNPVFPLNYEEVVKKAKEKDIIIEINNSSLGGSRVGSLDNCIKVAELCKKYGTKVILGSDSHFCTTIGDFEKGEEILNKISMPEELIMNTYDKIINHLKNKGKLHDL